MTPVRSAVPRADPRPPWVGTVGINGVAALALVAGLLALAGCSSAGRPAAAASTSAAGSVLPGAGDGATPRSGRPVRTAPGGGTPAASTPSDPIKTDTTPTDPTPADTTPADSTLTKPARVREITRACPYLSNNAEQIAEGKRVGRSSVLTTAPVGCRFYLAYPDYHAVAQISVAAYPSAVLAFNTVARTGGSTAESTPGIGDGAVLYRTHFYRPDGDRDWACIFAKGRTVVTVHTDATMSSVDARNVAAAIVAKF